MVGTYEEMVGTRQQSSHVVEVTQPRYDDHKYAQVWHKVGPVENDCATEIELSLR